MDAKKLLEKWEKHNVPPLGYVSNKKQEGVWQFMSSQINGMSGKETRETKIGEITNIINRYDVNLFVGMELGVNWITLKISRGFAAWFLAERELRATTSHNIHGYSVRTAQQGGIGMLVLHEILEYAKGSANNFRGLGRWSSFQLYSNKEHRTRFIASYSP